MGNHSGSRKSHRFQIRHTGRHSDKPIFEPDSVSTPRTPEPAAGRHRAQEASADATAARTLPLDPVNTLTPGSRHRRSRVWTSAGLSAAVVLISFGACAAFSTQTDSHSPEPMPTETPSQDRPRTDLRLAGPERNGDGTDPRPGSGQGTGAESPSAVKSQPRPATVPTVAPSTDPITPSPSPRVTITRTVRPSAPVNSATPQPTVTITETVRATHTAYLPLPRVTVTVRLPVPLPSG